MKLKGFTLVELQVALLILVLIAAVIMGGLHLATKSNKAVEKLGNESNQQRVISRFLKQQINSIIPLTELHNNKSTLLFKGDHHSLYYMGQLPKHVVTGGPWLIHLYIKNKALHLDYKVMNNQRPFKDNLHTNFKSLELVDNINEFSISYQKQADSSKQTTWRDKHTLPAIININIKQYKKSWPKMTSLVNSYNGTTTPYNVLTIQ